MKVISSEKKHFFLFSIGLDTLCKVNDMQIDVIILRFLHFDDKFNPENHFELADCSRADNMALKRGMQVFL